MEEILTYTDMEDMKMDRKQPQKKKFVRYKEGAELYSMCQSKFEQLAKEAKATYKVNKLVLVNCDLFEDYLEIYRVQE